MSNESINVVCDIGGTNTRIASVIKGGILDNVCKLKTADTPKKFFTQLLKYAEGKKIHSVHGGIRGVLLEDKSGIEYDSVLQKWQGISLRNLLEAEYPEVNVHFENDTSLAGLAEACIGAGKDASLVVYHTISTGVGGVKIENKTIDTASVGFEPGHQIIDIDRTVLGPDISPTLENLVSGNAVARRVGLEPYEIPQTDAIWEELAEYLGQGLRNTVLYWSPEVIVLGGSMITGNPNIPIESIRKATVSALGSIMPCPFITVSELGDLAVLQGAMLMFIDKTK